MKEIELNDISDNLLIINKITIERLFEHKNHNTLILYLFYYKTAKWQKTNIVKANDEYCKKCLGWGSDKLKTAKKELIDMGLIKIENRRDEKNKIIGWYVNINYFTSSSMPISRTPENPQLVEQELNTNNNKIANNINNNNINIIYNWNDYENCQIMTKQKKICERRSSFKINGINHCNQHAKPVIGKLLCEAEITEFKKPTLEEVKAYCVERNNGINAEKFISYYEKKDWKIGNNKMKDWKKAISTWEQNNKKQIEQKEKENEERDTRLRQIFTSD